MDEQTFSIQGFHCEACVKLATMKIKKISDIHEINISQDGKAKICAPREIKTEELAEALNGLGYTVTK